MPRKPQKSKTQPKPANHRLGRGPASGREKSKKVVYPRLLRGMKDILPAEQKYWDIVGKAVKKLAFAYGFEKIDTPILEETSLFVRTIGSGTDIVEKEMFSFTDKGGEKVTLRPESTAPIARAYIEHGMVNLSQPVKLYYFAPLFRYERPQEGRFREHHQMGFEVLGSKEPVIDAQLILLAYNIYQELGINADIQINSIGCPACRGEYKKTLLYYYRSKKNFLCSDCQRRIAKNPLRLLDCKRERCRQIAQEAPQLVDNLCEECKGHFVKVLEHLDEVEIPYTLNPRLVRGLDYYNKTVFEILPAAAKNPPEKKDSGPEEKNKPKGKEEEESGAPMALGGGGRYDSLVEMLGGQPTPACGFGCGVERVVAQMKEEGFVPPGKKEYEVFLAQLGESARKKALKIFEELRKSNVKVAENLSRGGLRSQLEIANKLGVKFTLILGQKEVLDGTILIRDMQSGIQEIVNLDKIVDDIKRRIKK